jgi:hypothetical protein
MFVLCFSSLKPKYVDQRIGIAFSFQIRFLEEHEKNEEKRRWLHDCVLGTGKKEAVQAAAPPPGRPTAARNWWGAMKLVSCEGESYREEEDRKEREPFLFFVCSRVFVPIPFNPSI